MVFGSAGNENRLNPPRGKLDKVLLVASVKTGNHKNSERADGKSHISNYGDGIDLVAPGDPIWSTYPGNRYRKMGGTSMATPVAASVAALVWSQYPQMTFNQVAHKVLTTSDDISGSNPKQHLHLGAGRVNALAALEEATPLLRMTVVELVKDLELNQVKQGAQLTVKFYGVVERWGRPFALFAAGADRTLGTLDDEGVDIHYTEDVFYGTNYKKVSFAKLSRGNYRFTILANRVVDPFGRLLDGDGDGVAGGDYVIDFTVK